MRTGADPFHHICVVAANTVSVMDIEEVVRLETEVWQALVAGDAEADARLLSDDFVGIYPTGFADVGDHVGQVAAGPTVERFELSDARMLAVSESAVLLSYRAVYTRAGAAKQEAMYVSSLWCQRGGRWVNVFSQDTPDTGFAVV